jgi:hypothetical protein
VYSPDTWTWEIRPIVDKTLGRWYLAFNPALERTLHGPDVNQGLGFSPDVKVSYDFTPKINGGDLNTTRITVAWALSTPYMSNSSRFSQ